MMGAKPNIQKIVLFLAFFAFFFLHERCDPETGTGKSELKNKCEKLTSTFQNLKEKIEKFENSMDKAEKILQNKSKIMNWLLNNYRRIQIFFTGEVKEFYDLLQPSQLDTFLKTDEYANIYSNDEKWRERHKLNVSQFSGCFKKLEQKYSVWNMLQSRRLLDRNKINDYKGFKNYIETQLNICENLKEEIVDRFYIQSLDIIGKLDSELLFYEKLTTEDDVCFGTIQSEYDRYYTPLTTYIESLNEEINKIAEPYYRNIIDSLNKLNELYDFTLYATIINKKTTLEQNINQIESVSYNQFNENEAKSLHEDSNNNLTSNLNYISSDVTDRLSVEIKKLATVMERLRQLKILTVIHEDEKLNANKKLNDFYKILEDIQKDYTDESSTISIHTRTITEIVSKSITYSDLNLTVKKEEAVKSAMKMSQEKHEREYKNKVTQLEQENSALEKKLKEVIESFESDRNELKSISNDYSNVKQQIETIVSVDIPSAVEVANVEYLNQKFKVTDPTETIGSANVKLDNTKGTLNDLKIKHDKEILKISSIKTEANDKSREISGKNNEFTKFQNDANNYESNLMRAYASFVSNPILTQHDSLNREITEKKSQAEQLDEKLKKNKSDIDENSDRVKTLKSNGQEILERYKKIVKAKSMLSNKKKNQPREFQNDVNNEIKSLNFDLNTDDIISGEDEVRQSTETISTLFDQYSNSNTKIISEFENIKSSTDEFLNSVDSTISDVTARNTRLVNMVEDARGKNTLIETMIQTTTTKKTTLDGASQNKGSYVSGVINRDTNEYGEKNQKVTLAKTKLVDRYETIKNLYINRHTINIDGYDKEYKEQISQYESMLKNLQEKKGIFTTNSDNVNTQLEDYKSTANSEYNKENDLLTSFKNSISECIRNLIQTNNYENYESLMAACNGVVTSFETQQQRNQETLNSIERIKNELSSLELTNVNYDESVFEIDSLNGSSDQLIENYKVDLKKLYFEKNKINFEDAKVQNIFNTFEEEYTSVERLTLVNFEKPDTKAYQDLCASINDEINIYRGLNEKYPKINAESVIGKLYNSLPGSVSEIEQIKANVGENLCLIDNDFLHLSEKKSSFDAKKLKVAQIKIEIDQLRASYDTHLTDIWDLSEDDWTSQHPDLYKSKKGALDEIKSKLQLLVDENKLIIEDRENYILLKGKIDSSIKTLSDTKNNSESKVNAVNVLNSHLNSYLEKYSGWTTKNEAITPVLIGLKEELGKFGVNFPTQLESLKSLIEKTIDSKVRLLQIAKTESLETKSTIEQKIASLSELYGLNNDELNDENKKLIKDIDSKLNLLNTHCETYVNNSAERRKHTLESLTLLQRETSTKSTNLLSDFSTIKSKLECCTNVVNGINCVDGTTHALSECESLVDGFKRDEETAKVNELNRKFDESLEKLKLPSTGDIFGVEQLDNLKSSILSLSEYNKKLEESFRSQFKQIKVQTVNDIMSKVDSTIRTSNDSFNNNIDAITSIKSTFKTFLDQYKAIINSHKQLYATAEIKFNNTSAYAEKIEKSISDTSKNIYIKSVVNKEPKISVIISSYSSDLQINKKFTNFHDQVIATFSKENSAFIGTINEARQNYDRLSGELEEIKTLLNESVNDTSINGKIEFGLRLAELNSKLDQKFSEINRIKALVLNGQNLASEMNNNIERSILNASAQINEFEGIIFGKNAKRDDMMGILDRMDAKSKQINKSFKIYEDVRKRLIKLREVTTLKYKEAYNIIQMKNSELNNSKSSKLLLLKLNQQKTISHLNKYFEKLNQLETTVNNAKIDLPIELLEIIGRNNQLQVDIKSGYADLETKIVENFSNEKENYSRQNKKILSRHTEIINQLNSHLNIMGRINNNLVHKSFHDLDDTFFSNSLANKTSAKDFIIQIKKTTYDVITYELEGDVSCESNFSDRILLIPSDIKPIDKLLQFLNTDNKESDAENKIQIPLKVYEDSPDQKFFMKENNEIPKNVTVKNVTGNNIVQGQMKDLKSFSLINFIIFLAFVVTIIGGIYIIIFIRRRNQENTLYMECDKVYVPVKI